ncbi:MAG: hypothetical protein RLN76_01205 [Phycisphaeraceae bacterium]
MSKIEPNLIKITSKQGYDKTSWLKEGDRHRESSALLRNTRRQNYDLFKIAKSDKEKRRCIEIMDACVYSSTLLIAYAYELTLKAGITCLYLGCSQKLFEKDIKSKYGHNLVKAADDLKLSLSEDQRTDLRSLENVLMKTGRYPIISSDTNQYLQNINARSYDFWDDNKYNERLDLLEDIRGHVKLIDADSGNPVTYITYKIDEDGYFCFRMGGRLSARITVKYSEYQARNGLNSRQAMRDLLLSNDALKPLFAYYWDKAEYIED